MHGQAKHKLAEINLQLSPRYNSFKCQLRGYTAVYPCIYHQLLSIPQMIQEKTVKSKRTSARILNEVKTGNEGFKYTHSHCISALFKFLNSTQISSKWGRSQGILLQRAPIKFLTPSRHSFGNRGRQPVNTSLYTSLKLE